MQSTVSRDEWRQGFVRYLRREQPRGSLSVRGGGHRMAQRSGDGQFTSRQWFRVSPGVTKPLFVAFLFAGLGLWFVLGLPSHVYLAGVAVAIALGCAVCLDD